MRRRSWTVTSASEFTRHRDAWDALAKLRSAGHPLLASELVALAIREFGAGLLLARNSAGEDETLLLLRRRRPLMYETFAPAQLPLCMVVSSSAQPIEISGLCREIGCVQLGALHVDSRYSAVSISDGRLSRAIPYAETMSIDNVESFDAYIRRRPKKLRDNLRRYEKRTVSDLPGLGFDVVTDRDKMLDALEAHAMLEQSGWKGAEGSAIVMGTPQARFYEGALQTFAERGGSFAFRLSQNGRVLASRFGVMRSGIFVFLKTAYSEEFRHLALGRLLQRDSIAYVLDSLAPSTIEFYTKADADQLHWATSRRMIYHVNTFSLGLFRRMAMARSEMKETHTKSTQ